METQIDIILTPQEGLKGIIYSQLEASNEFMPASGSKYELQRSQTCRDESSYCPYILANTSS